MKKVDAKGGNGNIFFDTEEGTATKYLRNTSSKEKIERFKREQIVLSEIAMHQISNIVEILEVHIDENINESFIKMKKYDGDLSNLFDMTKGNVRLTLELILPVIKSLKILSEYDPPIYHRDIKPENILYKKIGDTYELYLTDFGNCFVKNDDERLTPDNIAVGARMFLAPEYEIGKVEEVTEKGDIFSIGKIIWCMINGNANELLPSSFWYIKEYDLAQKFSNNKEMISANLIISSCLSINPKDRCNYNELIKLIKNTLDENYISTTNEKKLKVKQFQEMRKIKLVEILEKNKLIVNNFSIMFIKALEQLMKTYSGFDILDTIYFEYKVKSNDGIDYTSSNVYNNAAHYLYSSSFDNMYLAIDYNTAQRDEKYANITIRYRINSTQKSNTMKIKYDEKGIIICEFDNTIDMLSEDKIIKFLDKMIMDYIE